MIGNGHGVAVLGCRTQSMLDDIKKHAAKHGVGCHAENSSLALLLIMII